MISKQELVVEMLRMLLTKIKVGIIVKGVADIAPEEIVRALAAERRGIHAAVVGYGDVAVHSDDLYTISGSIESAVLWRSMPECARNIVVFIKNDADKLHSLAEFEILTTRDIARFLVNQQISNENNDPTNNFWKALEAITDSYPFESLQEFVSSVTTSGNSSEAIPQNMWRLNLLPDAKILEKKSRPEERLAQNSNLIADIGQLDEESRKILSRSLVKAVDKDRLQKAYVALQNLYRDGKKETLKDLDLETVQELFSASQNTKKKKTPCDNSPKEHTSPIRPKELDQLISDSLVFGDDEDHNNLRTLLDELKKHYDAQEQEDDSDPIPSIGGRFENRSIVIEHPTDLRKLVGKFCCATAWGGILETDECVLRDAISADRNASYVFDPYDKDSEISFHVDGGIDGNQTLFGFLKQFDAKFDEKNLEAERFTPIISNLKEKRERLLPYIDLIMGYPELLFGISEEGRTNLIEYINAWDQLYHAFCANEPRMREISSGGTNYIARALLLLDVLYVKTPKEWKGILLPLNPLYLWRYYEVFRTLPAQKAQLSEEDKRALAEVLSQLPQVLSFIVASSLVTKTGEDRVLPCSGKIGALPTFENKTNRYLGNDGTESVEEILTRWVGFAPYSRKEIRICSVDAPDLLDNIRQIKSFMNNSNVRRVVYDVYLTRGQNGNTELSRLDYSGMDYQIGEYIKDDRISISIRNLSGPADVKRALHDRPVHVAFYFDQSSYSIEYGPDSHNLYINPLVITYDYAFDDMTHKGSIFPSSEMDSGLIGDYHKLMRYADIISNGMNPRTAYSTNADLTAIASTIKDREVQWLVVADRDTNNYQPESAIPIGERQYDKRVVNVWAADDSKIISQYLDLLRRYNLHPRRERLIAILCKFGHIASNGLISIPRLGADTQAIENKKKGLIGTLFAASWYIRQHTDSMVASLDDDRARLWLQDRVDGNERADLVGLYYDHDSNTLHIDPIEVKTRDESPDATISRDRADSRVSYITGHAVRQIASMIQILREIFTSAENQTDMFISARREVLKYQIVSECFRNVHDAEWQKRWCGILKKAFSSKKDKDIAIVISGILLHIRLSDTSGGEHVECIDQENEDFRIDYWRLTSTEIQNEILGGGSARETTDVPDFDSTKNFTDGENDSSDAIIDTDIDDHPHADPAGTNFERGSATVEETTASPGNAEYRPESGRQAVSQEEIEQLVRDFRRSCGDYHVALRECNAEDTVIGPSVIRLKFKLGRGQALQGLSGHLEDIGREMKRTGVIIQQVPNSDELLLDVPRLTREKVLFKDVIPYLPAVTSPEQLYFPLGRTPNGKDLFEDLGKMPHMLVGGSTGSGKSVFLFSMLAALLMTHPKKEDLQLILSSSKLEDFIHFAGLPHLYSGSIISDAAEATHVIKEVVFEESERRGKLLADARVENITKYNMTHDDKLAPIVVVIDEFADLADQFETKKEQNEFYKPVQRIAQAGRSRGIHLVICTQRPEAKLVPSTTKAQLNGRVALRVNDSISSRMIIEQPDAQYLQKHGDMIYRNGDVIERAQGYLIEIPELDRIIKDVIDGRYVK